jgi:hypothetical protein
MCMGFFVARATGRASGGAAVNIPVNFHDPSVRFADAEAVAFLRESGVIRGHNADYRTLARLYSVACRLAGASKPTVEDWREAAQYVAAPSVQVPRGVGFYAR